MTATPANSGQPACREATHRVVALGCSGLRSWPVNELVGGRGIVVRLGRSTSGSRSTHRGTPQSLTRPSVAETGSSAGSTSASRSATRFNTDTATAIEEIVLESEQGRARPRIDADLPVDVDDVCLHRCLGDMKLEGDMPVRQADGKDAQDVDLALCEFRRPRCGRAAT